MFREQASIKDNFLAGLSLILKSLSLFQNTARIDSPIIVCVPYIVKCSG